MRKKRQSKERQMHGRLRRFLAAACALVIALGAAFAGAPSPMVPEGSDTAQAAVRPYTYGVTIDEYLGCTTIPEEWLKAHFTDGYYLYTPYRGLGPATGVNPLSISRFNGDQAADGACNCAGVPSALMRNCGGNLSRIVSPGFGAYVNATNWLYTATHCGILTYHFRTMDDALDSGVIRKGDLFYLDPISWDIEGIDCHIGVWWPDDPRHNMGIHSVPPIVQYSPIAADPEAFTVYVFPTRHADMKGYADESSLNGMLDYSYYYNNNPDLRAAFGWNFSLLYYHYTNGGLYENRRPSATYDPAWFRAHNPWIGEIFGDTAATYASLFKFGMSQGWQGSAEFDPVYYRNKYPDLNAAFGDDWVRYYIHYNTFGIAEGRKGAGVNPTLDGYDIAPVYNLEDYLANNPDVAAAYGGDADQTLEHFLVFGLREGRRASASFDVRYYRATYADLDAAFGDDWTSYYRHYLMYGQAEGRRGVPAA